MLWLVFVQKGHGYHLDLFVLSFLILICSFVGLPWFVAATVRALTHVKSLVRESEVSVPGERPQMLGIRSFISTKERSINVLREELENNSLLLHTITAVHHIVWDSAS